MSDMNLEVTEELERTIKGVLRVTHDSLDSEITDIIKAGLAEIQSKVGPVSFDGDTVTSIKALNLLKVYCFYSWNDMAQEFSSDNERDIIALQMHILQYGK